MQAWLREEREAWHDLMQRDPLLPACLLPPDYLGRLAWQERGSKVTWERASETVRELLAGPSETLPEDVRDKILKEIPGIVTEAVPAVGE